jgi:hypothetical protein
MTKPTKQTRPSLYLRIEYSNRISNPSFWIEKARELIAAAEFIEPSINVYWRSVRNKREKEIMSETSKTEEDKPLMVPVYLMIEPKLSETGVEKLLQSPYFMLMAFSFENYFKAIIVAGNDYSGELLGSGKIPGVLKNHDLVKLAEITGLALNDVELSLLTRLSVNSIWQGRYPAPANCVELNNMPIKQGKSVFTAYLSPDDIGNLHTFIRRLVAYVDSKVASMDKNRLNQLT